jgi:hypothetical protein
MIFSETMALGKIGAPTILSNVEVAVLELVAVAVVDFRPHPVVVEEEVDNHISSSLI